MRCALLAAAVLGCGDNRPPEVPSDVPLEDLVTISVTQQSVPVANIPVQFHSADGTLTLSTRTNINGEATGNTGPDGFVTAVTEFAAIPDIKTFVGVQPGDKLALDGAPSLATPMTSYAVRVTPVAGAVFYRVLVRCLVGTGEQVTPAGNPVDLSVTTTCLTPTPVLAVALDSFGLPIESVLAQAAPADNGVVDLTNEVSQASDVATVTVANVGADATLESSRAYGPAVYFAETEMQIGNGDHPTLFPSSHELASQTVGITGNRPVFVWGPSTSEQTIDVAQLQAAIIAEPSIDRATRTVTWTGGADANFVFGQLFVEAGGESRLWSFSSRTAGTNSLTLPLVDAVPIDAATRIDIELGVARVEGTSTIDGSSAVDELRRDGGWLDANNGLVIRQRNLFEARSSTGNAGLAFANANLTF